MSDRKRGNRLERLLSTKNRNVLSIYCTAGFPALNDTLPIVKGIEEGGADIIEIGMPFSDPVADGPTIQSANEQALKNGMTLKKLFEQLLEVRLHCSVPIILMGYLNPILQFGIERFCEHAAKVGVDGVILPDLPPQLYVERYKDLFLEHGLTNSFLVTPQTSEERIRWLDRNSSGFLYAVSSSAITGGHIEFDQTRRLYLERLAALNLSSPILVGFGVTSKGDFAEISRYVRGAIIGSAFIRAIESAENVSLAASSFVRGIVE